MYKKFSSEVQKKYFMFMRHEINKISKCSMIICGLTIGFIRFILCFINIAIWVLILKLIFCCHDIKKPLPKWRRCLAKIFNYIGSKLFIFSLGFICNKVIKKRI